MLDFLHNDQSPEWIELTRKVARLNQKMNRVAEEVRVYTLLLV